MDSSTTDPSINLQSLLLDDPLQTSSIYTPPPTPKRDANRACKAKPAKRTPDPKRSKSNKHLEASGDTPVYISFSSLGLEEPRVSKSFEISRDENQPVASTPSTAIQQIKSVLGIEPPQQ